MSKSGAVPRYRIKIIGLRDGEVFDDVVYCVCNKMPMTKKATFWYIKANVSSVWADQLYYDISKHSRVEIGLQISELMSEGEAVTNEEIQTIYDRKCVCLYVQNANGNRYVTPGDQNIELIFLLSDPLLYELSTKHHFNTILSDKTAFEAIEKYEEVITSKYGDNFYFNKVNVNANKSSHKYEKLLVMLDNDLDVTDLLLYNKKAMMTPSFYFFDDFCITDKVNKAISVHFINLQDIQSTEFEKIKMHEQLDKSFQTILQKQVPFQDVFKTVTNGCNHWNIDSPRGTDRIMNETKLNLFAPQVVSVVDGEYSINDNRKSKIVKTEVTYVKSEEKQKFGYMYTPDKSKLAIDRLQNFFDFVNIKCKQLVVTQTMDCYCDWLQFGRSYNLDLTAERIDNFLHTPIAICNIFYKDGTNKNTKHIAKAVMLEYYRPFDGTCSGCKHFSSSTCTLHNEPQKEENYCPDFSK